MSYHPLNFTIGKDFLSMFCETEEDYDGALERIGRMPVGAIAAWDFHGEEHIKLFGYYDMVKSHTPCPISPDSVDLLDKNAVAQNYIPQGWPTFEPEFEYCAEGKVFNSKKDLADALGIRPVEKVDEYLNDPKFKTYFVREKE